MADGLFPNPHGALGHKRQQSPALEEPRDHCRFLSPVIPKLTGKVSQA